MKKTITHYALALGTFFTALNSQAQSSIADFENFSLAPNSVYSSTTSTPFQTQNAEFPYQWDNGFSYWSGGFAYTNKYDSSTATSSNLYGVRAYKGYNNSSIYTVGQDRGVIKLKFPYNSADGFYITNTTYAYKAVLNGNAFSRKFGDTTGTGSGTTIAQGSYPDFFKVTLKGFFNGALKTDSVEFYLADYRFSNNSLDFVVNNWQWVNTSTLGQVDSIKFFMYSSDVGQFGINTPLFFAIDNFTASSPYVGLTKTSTDKIATVFPNPFNREMTVYCSENSLIRITDLSGKELIIQQLDKGVNNLDMNILDQGIYFAEINSGENRIIRKIIKK